MKKRADGRYVRSVTINGKRKMFYSSESTEKKAERDIARQMFNYTEKSEQDKTFKEVAEEWNGDYREKISDINYNKNTRAAYNRIIKYFGDKKLLSQVDAREINTFVGYLVGLRYYKKTIAGHKSILNMIFTYAICQGYTDNNPVKNIRLPNNLPRKEREMPSPEEIKVVDKHYVGFDFLPYFLLYTGLRISEALALTYEDIDFKNKTISITKHLLHNGNKPIIENKTKTRSSKRYIILLDRVFEKLSCKKTGLIFCNDDGSPLTKGQLRKRWEKYQKKYNITFTAHQLRHAYATMLFEAGIDLKDAQELMGHSDINLTRQIYPHRYAQTIRPIPHHGLARLQALFL